MKIRNTIEKVLYFAGSSIDYIIIGTVVLSLIMLSIGRNNIHENRFFLHIKHGFNIIYVLNSPILNIEELLNLNDTISYALENTDVFVFDNQMINYVILQFAENNNKEVLFLDYDTQNNAEYYLVQNIYNLFRDTQDPTNFFLAINYEYIQPSIMYDLLKNYGFDTLFFYY